VYKHIPNALTSLNLVCGCLAIIAALNGELTTASIYIGSAAILDYFDGFAARALKAYSEIGKQLDSLADVVSFGVAPGMIIYYLAGQCYAPSGFCINMYIPFLIPVFSAIRLAKFNIDTRQSDSFIGVPTPANGLFIASIPFIMANDTYGIASLFSNHYFLILFPLLSAYMLVAELPLLALKFNTFGWKGNEFRWILILTTILSVVIFRYLGVMVAIVLYILISIIHNLTQKNTDEI
jgi:CDP-diacylglycerol--serine O-phosphatidyltransferase